jgi:hypothetical protein
MEERVSFKDELDKGMMMNLDEIGSIRTLTYDETEELIKTGKLKSDDKFKKRKLVWMSKCK